MKKTKYKPVITRKNAHNIKIYDRLLGPSAEYYYAAFDLILNEEYVRRLVARGLFWEIMADMVDSWVRVILDRIFEEACMKDLDSFIDEIKPANLSKDLIETLGRSQLKYRGKKYINVYLYACKHREIAPLWLEYARENNHKEIYPFTGDL